MTYYWPHPTWSLIWIMLCMDGSYERILAVNMKSQVKWNGHTPILIAVWTLDWTLSGHMERKYGHIFNLNMWSQVIWNWCNTCMKYGVWTFVGNWSYVTCPLSHVCYDFSLFVLHITLFRSITMLCGTDIIPWSILKYSPHSDWIWGVSGNTCAILSVPHNIVLDLNNVMQYLDKLPS